MSTSPLLSVGNLSVEFRTREGIVKALENVSFALGKGETLGIVGESGSGKSVLSFSIMGILEGNGKVTEGTALFQGTDLLHRSFKSTKNHPHRSLSMIFQNPMTALNPICSIGQQIIDVLKRDRKPRGVNLREKALEYLSQVKIPADRFHAYPFQLSGGMCQRVMIALSLACRPKLLIADEPTTGLDVVTQEAIMSLVQNLSEKEDMGTILITHDLGLAARYCQRIVVMHAGHIVEIAPTKELFRSPKHPYTLKLIAATPGIITKLNDLVTIPGQLPDLRGEIPPCRYRFRCERGEEKCDQSPLQSTPLTPEHSVSCWNPL